MKKLPHIAAAIVAAITVGIWAKGGFHTGWTQTSIPVNGIDEITGIEYTTYQDGFIAGIDVLAVGIGIAIAISAITTGVHFLKARSQKSI